MRRIAALCTSLVFCTAACLSAQNAPAAAGVVVPGTAPQIRTSGTATRSVPADLAVVTVEIAGRGRTGLVASRELAQRAAAVRAALVRLGIPGDSLLTRSTSGWYWWGNRMDVSWQISPATRQLDTTYTARDYVVAHVRDLAVLARVQDAVLAAGAERLTGMEFQATRTSVAEEAALEEAARRARHNAEVLATALGGSVGRLIEITTLRDGGDETPESEFTGLSMPTEAPTNEGAPSRVNPSPVVLRAIVYGRWEFVPGR